MSFAFKPIPPSDISVYPYKVNKEYNISDLSVGGITLYIGENIPLNQINFFDPINDDQTSNNEYKRLIFSSIKHLFYKNYINEQQDFIESSSYDNYLQSSLYSGSYYTNIRKLDNITGSSFIGVNSIYNDSVVYDNIYLYDDATYNSNKGTLITVLSIDKNIYGNGIKPSTFTINTGSYFIKDDGEGNLYDYINEENYINEQITRIPEYNYIGNIIYSLGIIIITNQDYICLFNSPPTIVNDYYSYKNIEQPLNFDITANDYSDCNGIDYSSLTLVPLPEHEFPDCYIGGDGLLYIINNQLSYIPGEYRIGYTLSSNNGLLSNTGSVYINIDQYPLEITSFTSSKSCINSLNPISYSFNIFGGVPEYSYSWDNNTYNPISGFLNISLSGSILPTTSSLYIKDYVGNIISKSLNNYYDEILYSISITEPSSCETVGSIMVETNQGIKFTLDANPTEYNTNEEISISTGSYIINIYDINNCVVTSSININQLPQITYSIITSSVLCYGNNNGFIEINNITGGVPPYSIYYSSSLITQSLIPSNSISNLYAGNYNVIIYDDNNCSVSSNITITEPNELSSSINDLYINQCFSSIEFLGVGGTTPYTYSLTTPQNIYNSNNNIIDMSQEGLSNYFVTASIIDNNGCVYTTYKEIYGRSYIYSSSYCEQ